VAAVSQASRFVQLGASGVTEKSSPLGKMSAQKGSPIAWMAFILKCCGLPVAADRRGIAVAWRAERLPPS